MANNGIGVAGVCWHVSLMAVKAFDENGNGDVATAIRGIHYAIENGVRIINASWGNTERSRALEDVIAEAYRAGVLFVAAAGNNNSDALFYPAACDHVVAVGATDAQDRRARFSDFGAYVDGPRRARILTRRCQTTPTVLQRHVDGRPGHVSGMAALVLSHHPEFTPDQKINFAQLDRCYCHGQVYRHGTHQCCLRRSGQRACSK
ncbi:MAG: S8 family serine peptidase [Verrucomicrobiota bacterium]